MPRATLSLDLVCLSLAGRRLRVLVRAGPSAELPWTTLAAGDEPAEVASRFAKALLRVASPWHAQVATHGGGSAHPSGGAFSIAYLVAVVAATPVPTGWEWVPASERLSSDRQRRILAEALGALRASVETEPLAFRLLGDRFSLTDLQQAYEVLLGRRLHKASFRRALQAANLVAETEEWRTEGRGRPARLYRYAPKRPRGKPRSVRFDLLGE